MEQQNLLYLSHRLGWLEVTSPDAGASRLRYSQPSQVKALFARDTAHQLVDLRSPPLFAFDPYHSDVIRLIAEIDDRRLCLGKATGRPGWRFQFVRSDSQFYDLAETLARIELRRKELLVHKSLELVLESLEADFWG